MCSIPQLFTVLLLAGWVLSAGTSWLMGASPKFAMYRANPSHTGVYEGPAIKIGKLKWRFKTGGKVRSTPAIMEGIACVGSEDGQLYAVNAQTGQLIWKFKTAGDLSSSPAVAEETVFFLGGDSSFYALDLKTGQLRWKFPTGPDLVFEAMKGDPRTWDYYLSSPTLVDEMLYFGGGDGALYALHRKTGKLLWKLQTEGRIRTSPAVDAGVVYVGSFDHHLYAVDARTGQL